MEWESRRRGMEDRLSVGRALGGRATLRLDCSSHLQISARLRSKAKVVPHLRLRPCSEWPGGTCKVLTGPLAGRPGRRGRPKVWVLGLGSRASNSEQPRATNDSTDSTAACSTFPNSAVGGDIRLVFAWFCTLLGSTPQSTSNGIQPRLSSPDRLQKDTSRR